MVVSFRKRREVIQNGVAYNWDNTGYGLKFDNTNCKYGLNCSEKTLIYSVNHTRNIKVTYFWSVTWGKILYVEWWSSKERRPITWLIAGA
jgi:hypothetical protein